MPRAQTTPEPDEKPYLPKTPKPPKSPKARGQNAQTWTKEEKLTLLLAVLETAKPDWKKIAAEKFADKGRDANQVNLQWS